MNKLWDISGRAKRPDLVARIVVGIVRSEVGRGGMPLSPSALAAALALHALWHGPSGAADRLATESSASAATRSSITR